MSINGDDIELVERVSTEEETRGFISGQPKQVVPAPSRARKWLKRAAKASTPLAFLVIGSFGILGLTLLPQLAAFIPYMPVQDLWMMYGLMAGVGAIHVARDAVDVDDDRKGRKHPRHNQWMNRANLAMSTLMVATAALTLILIPTGLVAAAPAALTALSVALPLTLGAFFLTRGLSELLAFNHGRKMLTGDAKVDAPVKARANLALTRGFLYLGLTALFIAAAATPVGAVVLGAAAVAASAALIATHVADYFVNRRGIKLRPYKLDVNSIEFEPYNPDVNSILSSLDAAQKASLVTFIKNESADNGLSQDVRQQLSGVPQDQMLTHLNPQAFAGLVEQWQQRQPELKETQRHQALVSTKAAKGAEAQRAKQSLLEGAQPAQQQQQVDSVVSFRMA